MGRNIKITNHSSVPELKRAIKELGSYKVEVGIFGDEDKGEPSYVMIARVHEFGVTIRTAKSEIVIPERSFMRSTFDAKNADWANFVKRRIPKLLFGQLDAYRLCDLLGERMVADIRIALTDLRSPPNAPSTIAQKGSDNPLIDTGGLRRRITHRVVKV